MTTNTLDQRTIRNRQNSTAVPSWVLLTLGLVLTLLTGPRWGVGILAWAAPVPFLLLARRAHGRRHWLAIFSVLLVGFCAQCAAFATPPVPVIAVIGFGPPLALLRFGALAAGEIIRRRSGERAGLLAYVAGTVSFDWLGYGASEFGAWMATANSQVDWLPFLQMASIGGLALLGALMAWVAGAIAMAVASIDDTEARRHWKPNLAAAVFVLCAGLAWGTVRVQAPLPGKSVTVAAVVTHVGPTEKGLPDAATLRANTEALFERTRLAASRGARVVVWNEIATVIDPEDEAEFVSRGRALATSLRIDLVLAYAVLEQSTPVLFDNKYLFISDSGEVLDEYQKHHPVPGEPSVWSGWWGDLLRLRLSCNGPGACAGAS
jgi:apolipoprotein N-acyltransferase